MPTAQGDIAASYVGANRTTLQQLHTDKAATSAALAAGPKTVRLSRAQNGDGTTTVFHIPHGLPGTPNDYYVTPRNAVSAALHFVTADATNVDVTFIAAPASGTNNVTFAGRASIA